MTVSGWHLASSVTKLLRKLGLFKVNIMPGRSDLLSHWKRPHQINDLGKVSIDIKIRGEKTIFFIFHENLMQRKILKITQNFWAARNVSAENKSRATFRCNTNCSLTFWTPVKMLSVILIANSQRKTYFLWIIYKLGVKKKSSLKISCLNSFQPVLWS